METEPQKPREKTPAPSRIARFAWWFGIYLAAQLPLIKHAGVFWMYPLGLSNFLMFYNINIPLWCGSGLTLVCVPYVIYLVHLVLSLSVTKKRFLFMMILLIVIVSLNTVGCEASPPA
jgi:hypothetical protein